MMCRNATDRLGSPAVHAVFHRAPAAESRSGEDAEEV